jgi:hypothetical protein
VQLSRPLPLSLETFSKEKGWAVQNKQYGPADVALVPPWVFRQGSAWKAPEWQTGEAADYIAKWTAWFKRMFPDARQGYSMVFPEPEDWAGFYESFGR